MGSRKVTIKPTDTVEKCPKCSNNTEFEIKSQQVCEDCCEIWAVCKCGFDPTQHAFGCRIEDVWGNLNDGNCINAIAVTWNEMIQAQIHNHEYEIL